MTAAQIAPAALSLLALGAHFLRAGQIGWLACVLVALSLLGVRRPWAGWTLQAALLLGAAVWVRTLVLLARERLAEGRPATRMAIILGAVAAFTALSALALGTRRAREWFTPPGEG